MKTKRLLLVWTIAATGSLFGSDEEGRMSLFVVGCFTPEFQDIYDGDLDGYLLIGSGGNIDGSYLPRNYDNDIPNQNCDLPIRRQKRAEGYNVVQGTFLDMLFLVDNTSTAGGGPFDANGTQVVIDVPEGLIPHLATLPCEVQGQQVTCGLGTVDRFAQSGVAVRFYAAQTGIWELRGTVSSELFDPVPANNTASESLEVVAPKTLLVYPWISKNANFESVIVANNYGDSEALVWLSAVRQEGDYHARSLVIPPRGFMKETTANLFPELGEGGGYSLRLVSESAHIRGRWVTYTLAGATGNSPSQGVAVNMLYASPTKQRAGQKIMFGYLPISESLISAPVVVNMGTSETDVTLDFFNADGDLLLSDSQRLAGLQQYRPFASVANDLISQGFEDVYMTASSPSEQLTGVGFVFNTSGEPSIGNVTAIDTIVPDGDGTSLVLPWVSNNALFESIVVVNNFSDVQASLALTARRQSGEPETAIRNIPAHGFLNEAAGSLFPNLGQGSGYAVVVQSPVNELTGRWVTNTLTTASQASPSQGVGIRVDIEGSPRFGQDVLFGYLPLSDDFTSAPVVVNVGDGPADVTLRFYDPQGNLLVEDSTTLMGLEPFRPFATVANNLVPPNSGDVAMVASSNGPPISGVAFVFNAGGEPAIGNVSRIDFQPE